jgi:hypothetical protein
VGRSSSTSWYEGQRRVLAAAGRANDRPGADEWEAHHSSVTGSDVLLRAFRRRFDEIAYEDVPFLWQYLGGVASAELEESLVSAGAIRPLGFRFVGIPRPAPALNPL